MNVIAGANWRQWLRQAWPFRSRALLASYAAIAADHPLILADLALRGNVFTPIHETDPIAAARAEGRRQLALETIAICRTDPTALWSLIETKTDTKERT